MPPFIYLACLLIALIIYYEDIVDYTAVLVKMTKPIFAYHSRTISHYRTQSSTP